LHSLGDFISIVDCRHMVLSYVLYECYVRLCSAIAIYLFLWPVLLRLPAAGVVDSGKCLHISLETRAVLGVCTVH
jgi:hypothetical protein